MPATAATVNQTLTNYARGIAQDLRSALADFIAPPVPTAVGVGQYKAYDDKNAFQVLDTARAIGGPGKRLEFAATDPVFNCSPQALEIAIDDAERAKAGEGDPLGLERAKIDTLMSATTASHEAKVFAAIEAAKSAEGGVGGWSSADVDPVAEVNAQIIALATAMGMMPNRIAFGIGAWKVFCDHPKVIARQPGAAIIGLSTQQAAAMLLNPGIEIRVGVLSRDTAKFGAAKSAVNIVGLNVYVFYASPNPTRYDASFAKTFLTSGGGVDSVRSYRDDNCRSDIFAIDWSEDIKVTGSACARRLTIS